MNFNSHADLVVAVAVDLVNMLTEGERRGRPYVPTSEARLAALADHPLIGVSDPGDAEELTKIAGKLRTVFEAVAGDDMDTASSLLNDLLEETRARPTLQRHDGEPWHLHFHGTGGTVAADHGASYATGLAIVLGGEHSDRLGVCTAPHCDRVYVDVSRNGTRRFCSTACQNRVKTAAFRSRSR